MRLLWGHDQYVADEIACRFPHIAKLGGWTPYKAVGFVNKDDMLVGGVVLSDCDGNDAKASIWSCDPKFLTKQNLSVMFDWAFNIDGLTRVSVEVAACNKRSLRLVKGIGFRLEGIIPRGWVGGEDDKYLLGMLKENCPWIKEKG